MTKIDLRSHEFYPWCGNLEQDGILVRGRIFYQGQYFESTIPEEWKRLSSLHDFQEKLKSLSGRFALICKVEGKTILLVDRICIYPLFFSQINGSVLVSDSFKVMEQNQNPPIGDVEAQMQYLAFQSPLGNRTLLQNISTLMAGQYAVIDDTSGTVELFDYDTHSHTEAYPHDFEWLRQKHDAVVDDVFRRMIDSLHGRKVVLFLSGGYDSRLVITELRKFHYENVLCVSFKQRHSLDYEVAKQVAAEMGYDWMALDVDRNYVRGLVENDPKLREALWQSTNGSRTPYMEAIIIKYYIDRGDIPRDCVIVNGNSGDFIEGAQFCSKFIPGSTYSCDDILDEVIKKHAMLSGKQISEHKPIRTALFEELGLEKGRRYSYFESQELFEQINWRERQSKYVVNSTWECEEYLGTDWYIPLWDDALVDFWLNVPIEERAFRKLYLKMVDHEELPTANVQTPYLATVKAMKAFFMPVVRALYPVKKAFGYLTGDVLYYSVGFWDYLKILSYTKGYQTDFVSVLIYLMTQMFYHDYFGDVRKFIKKHLET